MLGRTVTPLSAGTPMTSRAIGPLYPARVTDTEIERGAAARDGDLLVVKGELECGLDRLDDHAVREADTTAVHQVFDDEFDLALAVRHRQVERRVGRGRALAATTAASGSAPGDGPAVIILSQQTPVLAQDAQLAVERRAQPPGLDTDLVLAARWGFDRELILLARLREPTQNRHRRREWW